MKCINIEQVADGKVKAKANIDGQEYEAEFSDIMMATVWAEELAAKEKEIGNGGEGL